MSHAVSQSDSAHLAALQALGLLAAGERASLHPLARSPERREAGDVSTHILVRADDTKQLLRSGPDLTDLVTRTRLFATAYPQLAAAIRGEGRHGGRHYVLSDYLPGRSAADVLLDTPNGPDRVQAALTSLAKVFQLAEKPSTVADAQAELAEVTQRVLALPYWTVLDRAFLESSVFPYLRENLIPLQPTRRVTGGDFILRNLLIADDDTVHLIDYEYAADTHFHREDWLRLTYWDVIPDGLKNIARQQLGRTAPVLVFLTLKQLLLESRHSLPQQAAADIKHWSIVIRQTLAQDTSLLRLSQLWPSPANAVATEDALQAQLYWMTDEGWSGSRSASAQITSGRHQTIRFLIPAGANVHALRFDPCSCPGSAQIFNFTFRQLDPEPKILRTAWSAAEFAFAVPAGDAMAGPAGAEHFQIISTGSDPQIYFNQCGGSGSSRLEFEVTFAINTDPQDLVLLYQQTAPHLAKAALDRSAASAGSPNPLGGDIAHLAQQLHEWFTGEDGLRARLSAEFAQQRKADQTVHETGAKLTVANALLKERSEELSQIREHISGYARTIDRLERTLATLTGELATQTRQREEALAHQRNAEDQLGRLSQQNAALGERARLLENELTAARQKKAGWFS